MEWDGQYDGLRESGAFFRPMRIPEQCSGEMLTAELQREFCFQPLDDAFIQNTGSRLLKELRKSQSANSRRCGRFPSTSMPRKMPSHSKGRRKPRRIGFRFR